MSGELGLVDEFTVDGTTPDSTYMVGSELGVVTGLSDTNGALILFETDSDNLSGTSPELGLVIDYETDEGNVSLIYAAQPDQLVNDTDIPQLPAFAQPAIVQYVVMRAFARDGEFQDLTLAQAWFAAFSDWMESTMDAHGKEWPTRVKSLEPYTTGNVFAARLRNVGPPGLIQTFGVA